MKRLISRRKIRSYEGMSEVIDKVQTNSTSILLQNFDIELVNSHDALATSPGQCSQWAVC